MDKDNNFVSGKHPKHGYIRTSDGYLSSSQPDMQHPIKPTDKNPYAEDFADMFMNYLNNSFAPNPAGTSRYTWMNDNMADWIGKYLDGD